MLSLSCLAKDDSSFKVVSDNFNPVLMDHINTSSDKSLLQFNIPKRYKGKVTIHSYNNGTYIETPIYPTEYGDIIIEIDIFNISSLKKTVCRYNIHSMEESGYSSSGHGEIIFDIKEQASSSYSANYTLKQNRETILYSYYSSSMVESLEEYVSLKSYKTPQEIIDMDFPEDLQMLLIWVKLEE